MAIPALPLRTPLADASGNLNRPWIAALQNLGGSIVGEVVLSVPGTIGIRSNAAPLVTISTAQSASQIVALLKQAPVGADAQIRVLAAGVVIGQPLTIPAGTLSASQTLTAPVDADALITLDVLAVGSTFPGSDLTVLLRF